MSFISYNVHPPANEHSLLDHLRDLQPRVLLIMMDSGRAMRYQEALPDTLIIGREWPDDGIEERIGAREWVDKLDRIYPDRRIVLYAGNEPHPSNAGKVAAWTVAAIRAATERGRRLCVCNWSMGTPEPHHWKNELRPVLEALQNTAHVMGLHEYHDASWGTVDNGQPWLIGRFRFLISACQEMNLAPPPIVITEHGYDSLLSDFKGWKAPQVAVSEDGYADALTWMDQHVYRPAGVLGQCLFSYGDSGGWHRFDVAGAQTLHRRLVAYARGERKAPALPPVVEAANIAAAGGAAAGGAVVEEVVVDAPVTVDASPPADEASIDAVPGVEATPGGEAPTAEGVPAAAGWRAMAAALRDFAAAAARLAAVIEGREE